MDLFNKLFGKLEKSTKTVCKEMDNISVQVQEMINENFDDNRNMFSSYTITTNYPIDVYSSKVKCHVPGFSKEDIKVTVEQLDEGIEICIIAEKSIDKNSTKYEYKTILNRGTPEQFRAKLEGEWVIVEYVAKISGKNELSIE